MVRSHYLWIALITFIWSISGMDPFMLFKLIRAEELLCTTFPVTYIGLFTCFCIGDSWGKSTWYKLSHSCHMSRHKALKLGVVSWLPLLEYWGSLSLLWSRCGWLPMKGSSWTFDWVTSESWESKDSNYWNWAGTISGLQGFTESNIWSIKGVIAWVSVEAMPRTNNIPCFKEPVVVGTIGGTG